MESQSFYAVETNISKTVVARLFPGKDIFEGIREICKSKGVTAGSIVTMLGSLWSVTLVCVTPDPTSETGARYFEPITIEGPLELVGAQGMIGLKDGEISVHLHGTVGTDEMEPIAGHIVDNGSTPVLATMEIVIQSFADIVLERVYDEKTDFILFNMKEVRKSCS